MKMLSDTLHADMITALKTKDAQKLEMLRYIVAQIKNKEIDKHSALTDEETMHVLRKIAKELKESIEAFKMGQRPDLADQSKNQLQIMQAYLPKEITDEELKNEIDKLVAANHELYEKNAKAIIGVAMRELKDKADPQRIMKALASYMR